VLPNVRVARLHVLEELGLEPLDVLHRQGVHRPRRHRVDRDHLLLDRHGLELRLLEDLDHASPSGQLLL
jgi:hypothetical protein